MGQYLGRLQWRMKAQILLAERTSPMEQFIRDLHVFLNDHEIAQGCHMLLTAQTTLTLRPALHHLDVYDLSDSSMAMLAGGGVLEVRTGISVLSRGEVTEHYTSRQKGKTITSIVFSPGLSLWSSSVSLSLSSGLKASDTMKALLAASGTGISLAAFAAEDAAFFRPQAFFGRICDALAVLAESVHADIFMAPAGVCASGRDQRAPSAAIPESSLLSVSPISGSSLILSTTMLDWLPGTVIQTKWQGSSITGRILSSLIQADNVSGPWKSELELGLVRR